MKTGVHSHVCIPPVPVDDGADLRTRWHGTSVRYVQHGTVRAVAGFLDSDGALIELQIPAITRLTTTKRVEHGAIQHDAVVVGTHDTGLTLGEIGILAIEMFGHARSPGACHADRNDSSRRSVGKRGRQEKGQKKGSDQIGSDPFSSISG